MNQELKHSEPESHAGVASAEEGIVLLDGPNGVAVTMTPDAAASTAHSLLAAADEARGQSFGNDPEKRR